MFVGSGRVICWGRRSWSNIVAAQYLVLIRVQQTYNLFFNVCGVRDPFAGIYKDIRGDANAPFETFWVFVDVLLAGSVGCFTQTSGSEHQRILPNRVHRKSPRNAWYLAFCECSHAYTRSICIVLRSVLGKTIVMVLLCHSSECGCFVCFA